MSPLQMKHQAAIDQLVLIAKDKGCDFIIYHAKDTHSSYLVLGKRNESDGFDRCFEIRFSDHVKPGSRFGLQSKAGKYHVKTSGIKSQFDKIAEAIPNCGGSGFQAYYNSENRMEWKND